MVRSVCLASSRERCSRRDRGARSERGRDGRTRDPALSSGEGADGSIERERESRAGGNAKVEGGWR